MFKYAATMVCVQFCFAVINILYKQVLNGGVNRAVLIAYRQMVSVVILIPLAYYVERNSWKKLTARLICQIFFCGLLGLTLSMYLFVVGLDYTSPTFTCAFINLVPVITFILSLPFGMEKINMKNNSGKAKVLGAVTGATGALLLSLYKGIPINPQKTVLSHGTAKNWGLGTLFLCAGSLCWSSWFLIQARVGQNYPYSYSSTTIMSFFSAVQSSVLCLITDRKFSGWILKGELQIMTVLFAGIFGSGICYLALSWCVKKMGPVFTSAFSPLIQIFAAILDVTLLREEIYLGSVLGSLVVVIGMYILLWGKSQDEEAWNHGSSKKITACSDQGQPVESTTQRVTDSTLV